MTLAEAPEFLNVSQVAEVLRISRALVYSMIARGDLKAVRCGRLVRIPREALEKLAGRRK